MNTKETRQEDKETKDISELSIEELKQKKEEIAKQYIKICAEITKKNALQELENNFNKNPEQVILEDIKNIQKKYYNCESKIFENKNKKYQITINSKDIYLWSVVQGEYPFPKYHIEIKNNKITFKKGFSEEKDINIQKRDWEQIKTLIQQHCTPQEEDIFN